MNIVAFKITSLSNPKSASRFVQRACTITKEQADLFLKDWQNVFFYPQSPNYSTDDIFSEDPENTYLGISSDADFLVISTTITTVNAILASDEYIQIEGTAFVETSPENRFRLNTYRQFKLIRFVSKLLLVVYIQEGELFYDNSSNNNITFALSEGNLQVISNDPEFPESSFFIAGEGQLNLL